MSGTLALTLRWGETDLAWVNENRLLVPLGLTGSLKISFWPDPLWLILTNYVAITIETDTPTPPPPPLPKKKSSPCGTPHVYWMFSGLSCFNNRCCSTSVRRTEASSSTSYLHGWTLIPARSESNSWGSVLALHIWSESGKWEELTPPHRRHPALLRRITTPLAQGHCDHR